MFAVREKSSAISHSSFIFCPQTMVADTDEFGAISDLVLSQGARGGQG